MKTVGKAELTNQLKDRYGYVKSSSNEFLSDLFDLILWNIEQGNAVSLHKIGVIGTVFRKPRQCIHPITGDVCYIPSRLNPKFVPSSRLKDSVKIFEDTLSKEEKESLTGSNKVLIKAECSENAGMFDEEEDGD